MSMTMKSVCYEENNISRTSQFRNQQRSRCLCSEKEISFNIFQIFLIEKVESSTNYDLFSMIFFQDPFSISITIINREKCINKEEQKRLRIMHRNSKE